MFQQHTWFWFSPLASICNHTEWIIPYVEDKSVSTVCHTSLNICGRYTSQCQWIQKWDTVCNTYGSTMVHTEQHMFSFKADIPVAAWVKRVSWKYQAAATSAWLINQLGSLLNSWAPLVCASCKTWSANILHAIGCFLTDMLLEVIPV